MHVVVRWGSKRTKATYRIRGKNLEEVRKAIEKRDEAGSFEWWVPWDYKHNSNKVVTEILLKPRYTLTMPAWTDYGSQPAECQKSWDLMWKQLKRHEDGHLKILDDGFRDLVKALKGLGPGTKLPDAQDRYTEEMAKIQASSDSYDSRTDHGRKSGVVLVVPAQCGG